MAHVTSMNEDLYVVGSAWLPMDGSELQLDEAVFEVSAQAIKNAGVKRHQIGLSITSSLDLYDGRSISNGLTAPAAGGYLNEELRVEGDAGSAMLLAMAALVGGQTEMAIIVGLNVPEIGSTDEKDVRRIREQVSSYTFDSHIDRPVGLSATTTLALHASRVVGDEAEWNRVIERTAADINRGALSSHPIRPKTTADGVARSPLAATPLTEQMLPAHSAAIGAVVIAVGVSGLRCPKPLARIRGWGAANGPATHNPDWLVDPAGAARAAAKAAYERAGLADGSSIASAEITDLSPAVTPDLIAALQLGHLDPSAINRSGGPRANYPGIANGLLRLSEAAHSLVGQPKGTLALSHSTDDLLGLTASSNTVLILEAL